MAENDNIDNNDFVEQDWESSGHKYNWLNRLTHLFDKTKEVSESKSKQEVKNFEEDIVNNALDDLHNKVELWLEKANVKDITKNELNDFFSEWKDLLNNEKGSLDKGNNNYKDEFSKRRLKHLLKSDRFKERSEHVVERIEESASTVEDEIKNWRSQPNLIARSLLWIVNWIMWTEK